MQRVRVKREITVGVVLSSHLWLLLIAVTALGMYSLAAL